MNTIMNLIKRILAVVLCTFIFITYMPGLALAVDDIPDETMSVGEENDTASVSSEAVVQAFDEADTSEGQVMSDPEAIPKGPEVSTQDDDIPVFNDEPVDSNSLQKGRRNQNSNR